MKELKSNFKAVKLTDTDVKLLAALQEDLGVDTESEVFREALHELARVRKVKVQTGTPKETPEAGIKLISAPPARAKKGAAV